MPNHRRALIEKLRWHLIHWINKRLSNQCWPRLVMWAQHAPRDQDRWLPFATDDWCRRNLTEGFCYCSKYNPKRGPNR